MQIEVGEATIDIERRVITTPSGEHPLREKEARILELLVQHHGEIVSRESLLNAVFGYNAKSKTRTLVTTMGRTRQALEAAEISGDLLQTVYGEGYRWTGPSAEPAWTPPQTMIGREHELSALHAHVKNPSSRLITLVGTGGIGKSTLAKAVLGARDDTCVVEVAGVQTSWGLM